jgi:hypothetical protein
MLDLILNYPLSYLLGFASGAVCVFIVYTAFLLSRGYDDHCPKCGEDLGDV